MNMTMGLVMKITMFFCMGVFEVMAHPIASGKWRAGDALALRQYYNARRAEDSLNKLLPPMMYFGSKKELPPTLYSGDETNGKDTKQKDQYASKDQYLAKRDQYASKRNQYASDQYANKRDQYAAKRDQYAADELLNAWRQQDDLEDTISAADSLLEDMLRQREQKAHSGMRGDMLKEKREQTEKAHSGMRGGDMPVAMRRKAHAGWRAGDEFQLIPPRLNSGWRAGDQYQYKK